VKTKIQNMMSNYSKTSVGLDAQRTELHDALGLTGAEISINHMPAGGQVPFVHTHKENEEIYTVLSGKGVMNIDGEDIELAVGDWLRVAPAAKRQFRAAADSEVTYVCMQVKQGSLEHFTGTDGVIL
jgi:uncharacterized cupin superfamily protein